MTDEQNQQDPQLGNLNWTPDELAVIQAGGASSLQINQIAEAGGAAAGEPVFSGDTGQILSGTSISPIPDAESRLDGESQPDLGSSSIITQSKESSSEATSLSSLKDASLIGSDVAPAVAQPGEIGSQPATGPSGPIAGSATPLTAEQPESGVLATGTNEVPESGEGAASLVGSQSASGTLSSASPASPVAATLAEGASDVKSAIARLRDHLWTFEHSAVRHLHAELDKIEAWFK